MSEQDVIVVGGGAAGLSAAVEATAAGATTLVVEACEQPGGAAALSGGGTFVVDSPLQRRFGIEDSIDLALADWLSWGGREVDMEWAERYIRHSVTDVFEWTRGLGVRWVSVHPQEGNSVPRWHAPQGEGAEVVRVLHAVARTRGVRWRLGARVTGLLQSSGAVTGVTVRRADGGDDRLTARSVVMATGGFTGSEAYVARYCPDVGPGSRVLLGGAPCAQGDGVRLLEQVRAGFVGLNRCWLYPYGTPDDLDPDCLRGMAVRGLRNEIWVNAAGVRFHDENARGGATGTPALRAQRPATCWSIFDADESALVTLVDPRYGTGERPDRPAIDAFLHRSPFVHRGETLAQVARSAGLREEPLEFTVRAYNAGFEPGRCDAFGRDLTGLRPIDRPPYTAVQYFPMARKALGGVQTDSCCQVLRDDGGAIPGLYAAGEVAGMAGGHVNGRAALEGTMFGPSLFSGRIAGRCAALEKRSD
jgi:predicted oxidoreductase